MPTPEWFNSLLHKYTISGDVDTLAKNIYEQPGTHTMIERARWLTRDGSTPSLPQLIMLVSLIDRTATNPAIVMALTAAIVQLHDKLYANEHANEHVDGTEE